MVVGNCEFLCGNSWERGERRKMFGVLGVELTDFKTANNIRNGPTDNGFFGRLAFISL